jgi:hypothetical protein
VQKFVKQKLLIAAVAVAICISVLLWLTLRDTESSLDRSIENSPIILLTTPEGSGRDTKWKVSQILKGPNEPGKAWSIGSTRYTRVIQTRGTVKPQSQVIFLGPKFFVTGPLEPQQVYPIYDGKLPAFGITLTELEAKIGSFK